LWEVHPSKTLSENRGNFLKGGKKSFQLYAKVLLPRKGIIEEEEEIPNSLTRKTAQRGESGCELPAEGKRKNARKPKLKGNRILGGSKRG